MTRLATVCDALAARLRTVIPATSYPAPRTLSGKDRKSVV